MGRNDEALAIAARINKEYGEGAIMTASEMIVPVRFPSGSLSLDAALNGGWAGNHWAEIYGPESHGKTAITLKTVAANQKRDPHWFTLWVASEHYDLDQATALGVDTDRVHVLSTQDMTFAYATVLDYLEARACDMVVIDSYPALIPPEEDEKDMDEYTMAEGAKMTNKFFRKVGKAGLRNYKDPEDRPWLGIFINQPREKAGTKSFIPGQVVEFTPGGRGKNFAFYTRLDVKREDWIKEGSSKVGQVIRTRAIKHKGGPPQRVASIDFFFSEAPEHGFRRGDYDMPKDILTVAVLFDVIHKNGGWYTYEGLRWNGIAKVLESLRTDSGLMDRVEKDTREAFTNPQDKRTWTDQDVDSASLGVTKVRRRRKKRQDDDDED